MNKACEICKGACCEFMALNIKHIVDNDTFRWLSCHGKAFETIIELDIQCKHLENGVCSYYDKRPSVCKNMNVGSGMCLVAIGRQRDNDPKIINELTNNNRLEVMPDGILDSTTI